MLSSTVSLRSKLLRLVTFAVLCSVATAASATDLSGEWKGHWESCTTGHKGPLKAEFCKIAETCYEVTFRGRFFLILPFKYTVTLGVVSDDGHTVSLAGDSYLGKRYGTFSYEATATEAEFIANYYSCKDDGKFVLCRVSTPCDCP